MNRIAIHKITLEQYLQNMTRWSNSIFEITAPLPFEMLHLLLTPFTMWARGDTLNVSLVVPNAGSVFVFTDSYMFYIRLLSICLYFTKCFYNLPERLRVSRLRVLNIGDLNERMAVFDVSLTSRSLLSRARVRTFCGKQSILVQVCQNQKLIRLQIYQYTDILVLDTPISVLYYYTQPVRAQPRLTSALYNILKF